MYAGSSNVYDVKQKRLNLIGNTVGDVRFSDNPAPAEKIGKFTVRKGRPESGFDAAIYLTADPISAVYEGSWVGAEGFLRANLEST